jgi:hypothetical protein
MNRLLFLGAAAFLAAGLHVHSAQPVQRFTRYCATCKIWGADTFGSQSGQFVVHGRSGSKAPQYSIITNTPALIELEPQLVAIAAERTRQAVLQELGLADGFQEKVHIIVLDLASPDQPIGIISELYSDRFSYKIAVPGRVESSKFVKALVQVVLLEVANRGSRRSAELPTWLVEGMTRQVLSGVSPALIHNKKPLTTELVGYDRLRNSRTFLQTNAPLTIQELSFNDLSRMPAAERERFESCSHLLVHSLLRLKGGPELMKRLVQTLAGTLNWQTAFFSAYQPYFTGPLDIEKWWMLNWLDLKNREGRATWSVPLSMQRLDALLLTTTEMQLQTNSIPKRSETTLQQLIGSTDFRTHRQVLGQKLQQLFFLSVNLSPELMPLASAYEQVIESYLAKRSLNEYQPGLKSDPEQRLQMLIRQTVTSLDQLDRTRDKLKAERKLKLVSLPPK